MRQKLPDLIFPGFLLLVGMSAFFVSMDWGFRTRIFPVLVTVALMVFAAAEIVNVLLRRRPAAVAEAGEESAADQTSGFRLRAVWGIAGWLLAYTGAFYLFGFLVAGVAMTFLYMSLGRRERWVVAAGVAVGAGVVIWVLETYAGLQLSDGILLV